MRLPHCWEIKGCGRERGGSKVAEFGECPASNQAMGHSCWAVAGTLCGGKVQGSFADKEQGCVACEVYERYSRANGLDKDHVIKECPEEQAYYQQVLRDIHKKNSRGFRLFWWM